MQCNVENKIFEPKIVELGTSVINGNQVLKIKVRKNPFQIDLKWDFYKV
jgi:hypothetical protein